MAKNLFLLLRNRTQAPSNLFSILSLEISNPNTNDKCAAIHFGKSPALPTVISIKVSPFCAVDNINFSLTNKL